MDLSLLHDENGFRNHLIEILGRQPVDFLDEAEFIRAKRSDPFPWDGAGVLLPLYFLPAENGRTNPGEYIFLLNKRSRSIPQGGDLCAPGGGVHPLLDTVTQKVLETRLMPPARGPAVERARKWGKGLYRAILFFLGNALRESWEEIHLSPFNVEFLGPLPTYRLRVRRQIIFPVVGRVKRDWKYRLSWEVEKMVRIPLKDFYDPGNYALYSLAVSPEMAGQGIPDPWEFPCLVHQEDGEQEILWGATFAIIQSFLRMAFDTPLPTPDSRRIIQRPLIANYLTGK
jgi:8-oxo-dGTP pyrophosphatase MutT (NUDIX family)